MTANNPICVWIIGGKRLVGLVFFLENAAFAFRPHDHARLGYTDGFENTGLVDNLHKYRLSRRFAVRGLLGKRWAPSNYSMA